MDVEEAGVMDCFVQAGAELQRTQVAPEADAYTEARAWFSTLTTPYSSMREAR